jgi:hypothetical protein
MSYLVNDKEYENVIRLSPGKRYEYFIKKCCDWQEIWSIGDQSGWCLFGDPHESECVPIWPAERYARAFCVDEWKDCVPEIISLDDWLKKWIPGLKKDKRLIAIFPVTSDKINSVVRTPSELLKDIEKELENY